MLYLLRVQEHSHPSGSPWGYFGLHSRAQALPSQGTALPQQVDRCGKQGLITAHPADRALASWGHHNLQWKREETGRCYFLHETNELVYPIASCSLGAKQEPLCSAQPVFSFLCSSGSTSLGPGRPQQSCWGIQPNSTA